MPGFPQKVNSLAMIAEESAGWMILDYASPPVNSYVPPASDIASLGLRTLEYLEYTSGHNLGLQDGSVYTILVAMSDSADN
jgi:hypothetical protein